MTSASPEKQADQPRPPMPGRPLPAADALVRDAFDDIALVVGGVAVLHNLDDDLTWTLMKRLDRIRIRLLRDLNGHARRDGFEPSVAKPPRVHPAVDEFLARNRAGMGE
jgi:hypothetical protein